MGSHFAWSYLACPEDRPPFFTVRGQHDSRPGKLVQKGYPPNQFHEQNDISTRGELSGYADKWITGLLKVESQLQSGCL